MTDQPNHPDEPHRLDREPPASEPPASEPSETELTGSGRHGAAGSDTATPGLTAGNPRYRDLTIARQLRAARASLGVARASLGAAVLPGATPTVPIAPPSGAGDPDDAENGVDGERSGATTPAPGSALGWARQRLAWAAPEARVAAVTLALLLAGVVVTVLPEDVARSQAPQPGGPGPGSGPGVQAPATTVGGDTASTAPGQDTGRGGQVPPPTGLADPFGSEPGSDRPVRSPTTQAPSPSQPGPLPAPPPPTTTSPPRVAPTTRAAPTLAEVQAAVSDLSAAIRAQVNAGELVASAGTDLQAKVDKIGTAASEGDWATARYYAAEVREKLGKYLGSGTITSTGYQALIPRVDVVDDALP